VDWTYRLTQWLWDGLDWLYPPVCGGCDRPGFRWCPDCQEQVVRIPEPVCEICGLPQNRAGICAACSTERPPYRALRSWVAFDGPIRQALHRLKYRRNIALGDALAYPLTEYLAGLNWPVEAVVPVPLGAKRMRERGYNQVGLVARPLAALTGWRYAPGALARSRETRSQVGLSAVERQENMRDAFRSTPRLVAGRTVLLMDDVATTGSTLRSGAEALLLSGAREVYALTIARALPHHGLKIV
jgi:competence protein ComFC